MKKEISATAAKNRFGDVLKMAETGPVYIVKHGKPRTVVVDAAQYQALVDKNRGAEDRAVDALRLEFDAMYARMQSPRWDKGVEKLLTASADELNKVAARRIRARAKARR